MRLWGWLRPSRALAIGVLSAGSLSFLAPRVFAQVEASIDDARIDSAEQQGSSTGPEDDPVWGKWTGPEVCIDEQELLSRVEDSFVQRAVPSNRVVEARAELHGEHVTVHFDVSERGRSVGERVLELPAGDCRGHDETIVLVFALLLEHGPSRSERTEALAETTKPVSESPSEGSQVDDTEKNEPEPLADEEGVQGHFSVAVNYVLVRGWVKGSYGGVAGGIYYHLPHRWSVGLSGAYLPTTTTVAEPARLKSWGGYVAGNVCYESERKVLNFFGCAMAGPMMLGARGVDVDTSSRVHFETAFIGANAQLIARLNRHFFLLFGGQVAVVMRRAQLAISVEDLPEIVYENSRFWGGMIVGGGITY